MSENEIEFSDLSRRRFFQASGMAVGSAAVLAACGGGDADPTTTTAAEGGGGGDTTTGAPESGGDIPQSEVSSINFDFNTPNITLQAPYHIAQSKGFFEEVGIESLNISAQDENVPPMLAGSIDIALLDATVLFAAESARLDAGDDVGLRMISINLGAQPLVMIGNEGVTADNLAGMKVGGARAGTTNEALAIYILGELGLTTDDVEFISQTGGSNDWVTAMLQGSIDATVAFSRHIPLAEEVGGGAIFTGFRPDPQAGFGMTTAKLEEAPNLAAAFNHAYIKGQQWCKDPDNWEEMREIIVNELGFDYPDNTFGVATLDTGIMTQDLGFDPDQMDVWLEFMAPMTEMDPSVPWREWMDISGLHAAQAALGLDINPSADLSSGVTLLDNF